VVAHRQLDLLFLLESTPHRGQMLIACGRAYAPDATRSLEDHSFDGHAFVPSSRMASHQRRLFGASVGAMSASRVDFTCESGSAASASRTADSSSPNTMNSDST